MLSSYISLVTYSATEVTILVGYYYCCDRTEHQFLCFLKEHKYGNLKGSELVASFQLMACL